MNVEHEGNVAYLNHQVPLSRCGLTRNDTKSCEARVSRDDDPSGTKEDTSHTDTLVVVNFKQPIFINVLRNVDNGGRYQR
jgi:hypothetical protein